MQDSVLNLEICVGEEESKQEEEPQPVKVLEVSFEEKKTEKEAEANDEEEKEEGRQESNVQEESQPVIQAESSGMENFNNVSFTKNSFTQSISAAEPVQIP